MTNTPLRVLLAGESWNTYAVHTKGSRAYETAGYEEGADELIRALRSAGHSVTYLPNHFVPEQFPYTPEQLHAGYDVVILSDLPADSLLLPHAVFVQGERRPNRTASLARFVEEGGGLLMIGGYMSFSGFDGRARYASTALADALPVEISHYDDRIELPEGVNPTLVHEHEILDGFADPWPYFLGYNRVVPKRDAEVLLNAGADPLLVIGTHGRGRTGAFTSDCSPHWGSPEFMAWPHYAAFWSRLVNWLAGR
jgi:uncharacterized membrane protein